MRIAALSLALALGVAVAPDVHGAGGVELDIAATCKRIDRAQLGRLLNIEQRRDVDLQQARVALACDGARVTLTVDTQNDRALPRVREFQANEVTGEVGARVLALAAIELWETSPAELKPAPAPSPAPAEPPVIERPPQPAVRLTALGTVRSFGLERPLVGGGLAVDYLRLPRIGLRLEFDVGFAKHHYDLGDARQQLTTLSAQAGYLALHDTWTARAYAGYRLGSARIAGESAPNTLNRSGTVAEGGLLNDAFIGKEYGMQ